MYNVWNDVLYLFVLCQINWTELNVYIYHVMSFMIHEHPTTKMQQPIRLKLDKLGARGGGVLNFELGTDVRPEVSTTTL